MDGENVNVTSEGMPSGDNAASSAADTGAQVSGAGFSEGADSGGDAAANQQTSEDTGKGSEDGRAKSAGVEKTERNSKYAEMRRASEREAANDHATERERAVQKERFDTIIAVTGGENPYTHEPIKDETDAQEYLTMRRIEQNGGDPLQDYAKTIKQENRDRAQREQEAAQKAKWYDDDRASFAQAYPDVDLGKLTKDAGFNAYAQGKVGKIPLADIYKDYNDLVGKITANVKKDLTRTVAQSQANRQASPGSLSGSGEGQPYFTREAVQNMTRAEIRANYDKIMESQKYWK